MFDSIEQPGDASKQSMAALPWGLDWLRRHRFPRKVGVLERLYGDRLGRLGVQRVRTACGLEWTLDLRSASHRRLVFGEYLGQGVALWCRHWLRRQGGVVVDIGANIGQTTLLFAPIPNVHVLAIEANPSCADWLERDLRHYPAWRVDVLRVGLAEKDGTLPMIVPDFVGEHGAQGTFRMEWYSDRRVERIDVPVTTFDRLLAEHGVKHVRLWKIDVEGFELSVLAGAEESLSSGRVDAIYAEVHPDNRASFADLMRRHGYALHDIDARGNAIPLATPLPPRQDYLAVRSGLA